MVWAKKCRYCLDHPYATVPTTAQRYIENLLPAHSVSNEKVPNFGTLLRKRVLPILKKKKKKKREYVLVICMSCHTHLRTFATPHVPHRLIKLKRIFTQKEID